MTATKWIYKQFGASFSRVSLNAKELALLLKQYAKEQSNETEDKLRICVTALKELVAPKGTYSLEMMEHAENTISDVSETAMKALKDIGEAV